jgi:hypothetical protein
MPGVENTDRATVIPLECVKLGRKGGVASCATWAILAKGGVDGSRRKHI